MRMSWLSSSTKTAKKKSYSNSSKTTYRLRKNLIKSLKVKIADIAKLRRSVSENV
jgi:hypothetical protein